MQTVQSLAPVRTWTTPPKWERPALIIAAVAAVLLVVRFFWQIHTWAIDIIFWDQFAFYSGAWDGTNEWALFRWQHGPHRMGLGLNIMRLVNDAFAYDQRVMAFFVGGTMLLAAVSALWLRRRLIGDFHWYDIAIPLLLLSGVQWELYASCVNLSHGALPLLLVILIALCFTMRGHVLKYILIAALTYIATFTGFGFFCIVAVPGMLLVRMVALIAAKQKAARLEMTATILALAACGATAWSFFYDYVWEPSVPGFVFPHPRPWEYLEFMAATSAYLFGARFPGIGKVPGTGELFYGFIVLAAFSAAGVWCIRRIIKDREDRLAYVGLFLFLFSAAFLANMAIGRVCTGLEHAMASRYMPLVMPAGLGLYLVTLRLRRPSWRAIGVWLLLIAFAVGSFHSPGKLLKHYVRGKTNWLIAYRASGNYVLSEQHAGFQLFPAPVAFGFDIPERVRWLEKHQLSFTRGQPLAASSTQPANSPK